MISLRLFLVSAAVFLTAYYIGSNEEILQVILHKIGSLIGKSNSPINNKIYTVEELEKFNGKDQPQLYLSILGTVFDVTKGAKHYGPGQHYNFFVGRDSSRSFITGRFCTEEVNDRIDDLNNEDLKSLLQWEDFYKREYTAVGKLIGTYYDENGEPTEYHEQIKDLFSKADKSFEIEKLLEMKYPPCNVEWSEESGTRVWCTNKSGGVQRPWIGVPRQLYEVGSKDYRCACIDDIDENLGNIKEYPNCPRDSVSCLVKDI